MRGKHKWKREKKWQYLIISRCENCGLQRQKKDGPQGVIYVLNPFNDMRQIPFENEHCVIQ